MNLPKFTADSSIYASAHHYQKSFAAGELAAGIQPAFPISTCVNACCDRDPVTHRIIDCDGDCLACCRHPNPHTCM
jgi:hypothetical protein